MNVKIHKQVSFTTLEKELFQDVINLLRDLQEILGEVDYDTIEEVISDIEQISYMEWDLGEED